MSASPDSFAAVLDDLWTTIADETPALAAMLRDLLASTPVTVRAAGNEFTLTAQGVRPIDPHVDVVVSADAPNIAALVTGTVDLAGAVTAMSGFDVRGPANAIAVAERVLQLLVVGAVRSAHADAIYSRVMTLCAAAEMGGGR